MSADIIDFKQYKNEKEKEQTLEERIDKQLDYIYEWAQGNKSDPPPDGIEIHDNGLYFNDLCVDDDAFKSLNELFKSLDESINKSLDELLLEDD